MQVDNQYRVTIEALPQEDLPEKARVPAKNNLLTKLRAKPCLSASILLLLLGCVLALILGLVLGLRGSTSNAPAAGSSGGASSGNASIVSVPGVVLATSSAPLQSNFVSFAIEYAFLPEFAGNNTNPNLFSYNVLSNIENISGMMPYVRVGGDSADTAMYDPGQSNATAISYQNANGSMKFGSVSIGPLFFKSFETWPGVKFIVGLNFKDASSTTEGLDSMLANVAASCGSLKDNLLWWEYGNEPDRYGRKPSIWNSTSYVEDWKLGASKIKETLQEKCPDMANDGQFGFVGPSLFKAGRLPPAEIITNGYNSDSLVKEYALHHYMADCRKVACDQQSMLLNHTYIKSSLTNVTDQMADISNALLPNSSPPTAFVLDEISMFLSPDDAPPGTSDTFGAALWALDFSLYCACIGISRIHMQQGLRFNYNSWSPVNLEDFPMDVYPIYYGNIAAASALGNFTLDSKAPRVIELDIPGADEFEAAYAIYQQGKTLSRIVVINLHQFNGTTNASQRANRAYTFDLPSSTNGSTPFSQNGFTVPIARLVAAGVDSKDGVTYNGYSYQYNLAQGKAAKVKNSPEVATVLNGHVQISLLDSSAVVLDFQSGHSP